MIWEREFSIQISNKLAATLITPRHVGDAIERMLFEKGLSRPRAEIDAVIKASVLDIGDVSKMNYHPDAKFIDDFGLG